MPNPAACNRCLPCDVRGEITQNVLDKCGVQRENDGICLESEGAEIHFRNIRIMELPPGITTPENTAKVVK